MSTVYRRYNIMTIRWVGAAAVGRYSYYCLLLATASVCFPMIVAERQQRHHTTSGIFPVTLPEGGIRVGSSNQEHPARERQQHEDRELSLENHDPTGFMTKFHACSASDSSFVILEACLDYQDGFGDACGLFTVKHEHWVAFHHNLIILRMMKDFCAVCEQECRGYSYVRTMPDICSIRVWDEGEDTYCDTFCTSDETAIDDRERKKTISKALMEQCFLGDLHSESNDPWETWSKTCHTKNDRNLFLDDAAIDKSYCSGSSWFGMWVDSCDTPGYPSFDDAIADIYGSAWLRCSFQGDGGESSLLVGAYCEEFRQRLAPCDARGWTSWRSWAEDNRRPPTPPPVPGSCPEQDSRPAAAATTPPPTTSPTAGTNPAGTGLPSALHGNVVDKEKSIYVPYDQPRSGNPFGHGAGGGTGIVLFLGLGFFGVVVAVVVVARRGTTTWQRGPPIEQPRAAAAANRDEPAYHRIVEMNDISAFIA